MKITRRQLRRLISEMAMVTHDQLPPAIGVNIHFFSGSRGICVTYCGVNSDGTMGKLYAEDHSPSPEGIHGYVEITQSRLKDDNCGGAWEVVQAMAADGYGPLIYDIAMEVASIKGSGIVADRRAVSREAQDVWDFYLRNRSQYSPSGGDVDVFQCDDTKNTLTPDDWDNMSQRIPKNMIGYEGIDWTMSPLSKRYSKRNTTIMSMPSNKLFITRD